MRRLRPTVACDTLAECRHRRAASPRDQLAMELFGLVSVPTYVLVSAAVGLLTFIHYRYNFTYFSRRGIKGPTPLPLLGTSHLMFKKGLFKLDKSLIDEYGKNVGLYEGYPTLLTSDEDIMREVMVKGFHNFTNRKALGGTGSDDVISSMLTNLKDDAWKRVRSTLTPTFSTGKLKQMTKCINECAITFIENLGNFADNDQDFEMKEAAAAFTLDVIARTGFGIVVNSQKDKNDEFYVTAKKAMTFKFTNPILLFSIFFPQFAPVAKKLGASFIDKSVITFFSSIIDQAMKHRTAGDRTHKDLIQLMVNAHKDDFDPEEVAKEMAEDGIEFDHNKVTAKALTKTEILAQGLGFFLAGYDTTSNGIALLMYCLALNPECQTKAQEEIDRIVGDKDEITYADVNEMTYLAQCFNESSRLFPSAPRVDRIASRDVTIKGIPIEKDTVIALSIIGRHMDPEIWPEPEKFDPDRFSPEEKARHGPFDHMPFGYGPRNCIAMRLALMEVKMAAALVLKNFTVLRTPKTEVPLQFRKFQMVAENGLWLKLRRRGEE